MSHLDDQPVGEDGGAASDSRAVAARLTDHRSRFAGDGGFVHRGGALHDLAVGRDLLPGPHEIVVAPDKGGAGDVAERIVVGRIAKLMSHDIPAGGTQCVSLGLAPPLCNSLCKVGEEGGQPEDDSDGQDKAAGD